MLGWGRRFRIQPVCQNCRYFGTFIENWKSRVCQLRCIFLINVSYFHCISPKRKQEVDMQWLSSCENKNRNKFQYVLICLYYLGFGPLNLLARLLKWKLSLDVLGPCGVLRRLRDVHTPPAPETIRPQLNRGWFTDCIHRQNKNRMCSRRALCEKRELDFQGVGLALPASQARSHDA